MSEMTRGPTRKAKVVVQPRTAQRAKRDPADLWEGRETNPRWRVMVRQVLQALYPVPRPVAKRRRRARAGGRGHG